MRRAVLATTALAASITLLAAPAFAAAAPVGYALTWDSTTLYQLDEGATPVEVAASTGVEEVTGLDFDSEGNGFAVTFTDPGQLWAVTTTGDATLIGEIEDIDGNPAYGCTALDYTDGVIAIACDDVDGAVNVFGTVDPTTAVITPLYSLSDRVASIASNPTDDTLYGFTYTGTVLAIGVGADTTVGSVPGVVWGADFDSTGTLWAATDETITGSTLLSWPLVAFTPDGYDPDGDEFIENISVFEADAPVIDDGDGDGVVTPELAATGLPTDTTILVGIGGALALLTGLALAMGARRAARQS